MIYKAQVKIFKVEMKMSKPTIGVWNCVLNLTCYTMGNDRYNTQSIDITDEYELKITMMTSSLQNKNK